MALRSDQSRLHEHFQFSQGSLQDFLDCPRRFELKYIEQRAWPALITEPALEAERRMLRGAAFHHLVQQHLAGISAEQISKFLTHTAEEANNVDDELLAWWQTYLDTRPFDVPGHRYVEHSLCGSVSGRRLTAKLDLLVIQLEQGCDGGSKALIVDWKTSRPQKRDRLAGSLQTRVYRLLAVRCAAPLNGGKAILPGDVEMLYWYAQPGAPVVRLPYNPDLYQADVDDLGSLMTEISCMSAGDFPKSIDEKQCKYCVYRSLCDRGVSAGDWNEDEDLEITDLNLEDVEEIAF